MLPQPTTHPVGLPPTSTNAPHARWTAPRHRISRAQLTDILQYIPHIPSICCAAAHPALRYARETVAGTRADHGVHHRGDLYVCWDWTTDREYHSFSGGEDELAADLQAMSWWLTRPFLGNGEPMILEVNVKKQAMGFGSRGGGGGGAAAATSGLESILRLLSAPPYQRVEASISCLRSLILTPNRLEVTATVVDLLRQLTHLEKLECFSQVLSLPLPAIPSVYVLKLRNLKSLTSLTPLLPLAHLRKLSLCRCSELHSLAALSQLPELSEVRLANCRLLDLAGDFSACHYLSSFSMRWCKEVRNIAALATLPNLCELDCSYCGLDQVEGLVGCVQLRRLSLRGCQTIHHLFAAPEDDEESAETRGGGETQTTNVVNHTAPLPISLSSTSSHNNLSVSNTSSATSALLDSSKLLNATSAALAQLEELDAGESSLVSLSGVAQHAPELRQLTVRECKHLHSLSPLGRLPTLTSIDASFSAVNELQGLSDSCSLQYVNLKNCLQLRSVAPLAKVSSLREVDLSVLNQNCIICIDDPADSGVMDENDEEFAGSRSLRQRRNELIVLSSRGNGASQDDTQIDTAVTQRSVHGMSQHHILRKDAATLLSQPLSHLRISEAGPTSSMW